ncbi:MAG: hypothetical protein FD137_481 [Spirochaetes bacterium]|nr:MAG: hypothetical protein FD137_481 [Spirochaetota bacterium]
MTEAVAEDEKDLSLLPESGRNLAQIMGLRFLTNFLGGDR